jgi:hypothetical protein
MLQIHVRVRDRLDERRSALFECDAFLGVGLEIARVRFSDPFEPHLRKSDSGFWLERPESREIPVRKIQGTCGLEDAVDVVGLRGAFDHVRCDVAERGACLARPGLDEHGVGQIGLTEHAARMCV